MVRRPNVEVAEGLTTHYLTQVRSLGRHSMGLWWWCVSLPQNRKRTFGLLLNKGELSGVTSPQRLSPCAGGKWETRAWRMETGEAADYVGVTLLPSSSSLPVT